MIKTGPRNLITDVAGLRVGQAEDTEVWSGVSVVICDAPCRAAVDVRGGAPGTHETDMLDPANLVGAVDAVVLSGGSAYGLAATAGVMGYLGERGRGFRVSPQSVPVPIVPGAILFDLDNGGDKTGRQPFDYAALGRQAAAVAGLDFTLGTAGAGYGAIAGIYKGGLGSASVVSDEGYTVGALVAVNAVGSPVMPGSNAFWAWPWEMAGEFGARRPGPDWQPGGDIPSDMKHARAGANTTIAVLATDADLTRIELKRLAIMAADGFARALRPAHSPFDGDAIFSLATAARPVAEPDARGRSALLLRLGTLAGDCMARAIARGVYAASSLG
ncbi:MAG: P1 family peptidase, partial [Rhizomicrobium sp.]